MEAGKNYLLGVYSDEQKLLKAIPVIRTAGVKIEEVYSPFPVHGIDDVLGYKRSKLPIAAFFFGLLGTSLALLMQFWMMGIDWPMNIGGKNYASLPTFIPVTFELTVLLSALGMVGVFFVISDLKPYSQPKIFDLRITDDKHVVAIDLAVNSINVEEISQLLQDNGADEINKKSFED
ncbi:MAG: DUF3341 domain-containing protein [Cyclobacteriaceae bacterium]